MARRGTGLFRILLGLLVGTAFAQQPGTPQETATLQRYCLGCHNSRLKSGGFALEGITPATHPAAFEKIIRKLRARQMPPAGLPRPKEEVYQALVHSFESTMDAMAARNPNPGRTETFRRLTRYEYRNAVRDLLAVEVDVSSLLPKDDASHGFDNVTVGELSPALLERYLGAARKIARLAVGTAPPTPSGHTYTVRPDLTQEKHIEGLPLGTRGGLLERHTFPLDGEYEFQIRLARDRNEHVEGIRGEHEVELLLDGERVRVFTVKPPDRGQDHSVVDRHLIVRASVKAGLHQVGVAFPAHTFTLPETERQPSEAYFNMDRHPRRTPAVYALDIRGPYQAGGAGDTESRKRVFSCRPANAADEERCAVEIVRGLARRAWRRPVTPGDVARPMALYREARAGQGFEHGIEMAVRAILVSPEFLFRIERDPAGMKPGEVYRISDLELASRLSFFLWSSIPDDELLAVAERGELHLPQVLEQQTRRMLADPRSRALTTNFAGQWLYLRNLDAATPDMRLFPDFDDNLRQAFRKETELFFEHVQREDRSVLEFLHADYTFLNERLARHYGIPRIYGSHFRKVQLGENRQRGGLLRHGSILTVTSYATRTSPVIRGKWILDNILGVPPPPPPPDVPALKENTVVGKFVTMRQRLADHRSKPACMGCHQLMDPVGFSLENYDAVGRWRELESEVPVDTSGGLPDGSQFNGVDGLERALLQRPNLFASTLAEKLLIYALGRGVESHDATAVRTVVSEAAASDFRFSSIILGVTRSAPFQWRKTRE
jgi:hypothetical protein